MISFYPNIDIIANALYYNNYKWAIRGRLLGMFSEISRRFPGGTWYFYILMPDIFNQGDQCNNEHPQSQKIGKC